MTGPELSSATRSVWAACVQQPKAKNFANAQALTGQQRRRAELEFAALIDLDLPVDVIEAADGTTGWVLAPAKLSEPGKDIGVAVGLLGALAGWQFPVYWIGLQFAMYYGPKPLYDKLGIGWQAKFGMRSCAQTICAAVTGIALALGTGKPVFQSAAFLAYGVGKGIETIGIKKSFPNGAIGYKNDKGQFVFVRPESKIEEDSGPPSGPNFPGGMA